MLLSTLFLSLLGCTPELNDDTQTEWHTEVKDTNDHVTQVDWVEESCIVSVNDSYCNFSFMDQIAFKVNILNIIFTISQC